MKIKNFDELARNASRKDTLYIIEAGLAAVDTERVLKESVRVEQGTLIVKENRIPLKSTRRIFVVGVGKCSTEAAAALEDILGERIYDGLMVDVRCDKALRKIRTCEGEHPFPTEKNIDATRQIIALLKDLAEDDLVLFIVSGGGSTLLCQPTNFTCQQETDIVRCLFEEGAVIQEINTIRKHLSLARGGYLAKYAYPAKSVALIFSDVPGDNLEFVASGPTVKDTTTAEEARKIIEKYDVWKRCGFELKALIETPKDEKFFERVENILLVSNKIALEKMASEARRRGFQATICDTCLTGEARATGENLAREINAAPPKTVLLYGGETTVTVKGKGKGGRNQEVALSAARFIGDSALIAAVASDGRDNGDRAGALCDILTKEKAEEFRLDLDTYLANNDSYHFFEKTGDYLLTGHTGSNVSDLTIAIKN